MWWKYKGLLSKKVILFIPAIKAVGNRVGSRHDLYLTPSLQEGTPLIAAYVGLICPAEQSQVLICVKY